MSQNMNIIAGMGINEIEIENMNLDHFFWRFPNSIIWVHEPHKYSNPVNIFKYILHILQTSKLRICFLGIIW